MNEDTPSPRTVDPEITASMAGELLRKGRCPMEIVFAPVTVFQVTALIQLSLRHPEVPSDLRATAERFLSGVREYFSDCPKVLDIIRRGDDPAEDR